MSGDISVVVPSIVSLSELESALPVSLRRQSEMSEQVPEFLQLLRKLTEKLEPSGRTRATQKRLMVQKENTSLCKRKFLEVSLKVETLNEVILKNELNSHSLPGASHETALVARLREGLTLAEVNGMIDLGRIGDHQVTTLCLDPQDPRLRPKLGPDFAGQVLPLIEEVLHEKCVAILQLLDPSTEQVASQRAVYPQLLRMGERVGELVSQIERDHAEELRLACLLGEGYQKKLCLVQQVVAKLDSLVTDHYMGSSVTHTKVLITYLGAKAEALVLKLKCLEFEILNATYTKDSVAAVRIIRSRLTRMLEDLEEELVTLRSTLSQYQAAGPDFSVIVMEYARLQKEIEGKRWALNELN